MTADCTLLTRDGRTRWRVFGNRRVSFLLGRYCRWNRLFAADIAITGFGRSRWRNRRLDRRLRRWRNIGAVGDAAKIQVEGRQQLKARAGHALVLLRRHGVSTAQLVN